MRQCPGCEYLVPEGWSECRRCGAPLAGLATVAGTLATERADTSASGALPLASTPPGAPSVTFAGSPPSTSPTAQTGTPPVIAPGGPPPVRRGPAPKPIGAVPVVGFGEELLSPTRRRRPMEPTTSTTESRGGAITRTTVLGVILAGALVVAGLWFALVRGAGDAQEPGRPDSSTFTVLSPVGLEGLPSLEDIPRVEAEANLQRATWTVVSAAAEVGGYDQIDIAYLAGSEQSFQWLEGTTASEAAEQISVFFPEPGVMALAVDAGEGKCGYVRDVGIGARQVTIATDVACRAADVPAAAFDTVADVQDGPVSRVGGVIDGFGNDRAEDLAAALEGTPTA